jgi:hypothetical protein
MLTPNFFDDGLDLVQDRDKDNGRSQSYERHVLAPHSANPSLSAFAPERNHMDAKLAKTGNFDGRIHDELVDAVDEELELEIDDDRLRGLLDHTNDKPQSETLDRHARELLRLQKELVKLQDWVAHHKPTLVVLFEGRDAAGKGGVIK